MNPSSNLILTVRLTGKLPRTKRLGPGKCSFILCSSLEEIFGEREKKKSEGFEETS